MTENDDIRSLLTSRARKQVAPRDNSLLPSSSPLNQLDTTVEPQTDDTSQLEHELEELPKTGKRIAVHLEQGIRSDLLKLCEDNDITPEIFIEAAIALLQKEPDQMTKVIIEANERLARRKRAGLIRRTLNMMEKYKILD